MPATKVFISYSHKDEQLFEEFLTHLAPFERELEIHPWSDKKIGAGEDWDREIKEAMDSADAAVLLVSPRFLDSEYIDQREIPHLIEAGRLLLTSLYLDHANADVRTYGEEGIKLTKHQGLNDPKEPVAALSGAARSELLVRCAQKLAEMLGAAPDRYERQRLLERRELTVELRSRDGHVDRRYSKPRYDNLLTSSTTIDRSRLEALLARSPTEDGLRELGAELYKILLGDDEHCLRVLNRALPETVRSPLRFSVRVRILTRDPKLRELPWALTSWHGSSLAEAGFWTFELCENLHPQPVARLHTPCTAVMIGAEMSGSKSLDLQIHHANLEGIFRRAWDDPPRRVCLETAQTLAEVHEHLREQPRLLYAHAHARGNSGSLELLLGADEGADVWVPLIELATQWGGRPPQVLFLNTFGECPLAPALPGVPLLYHQRQPEPTPQARRFAQRWWQSILGDGLKPVPALHEIGTSARHRGAMITAYELWESHRADHTPKIDRPGIHLDRKDQRRAIWDAVRELATNTQRRVTCVIAYGAGGSLVEHFSLQAMATLKDWALELARIERDTFEFPESRDRWSVAEVEESFRYRMSLQPEHELSKALEPKRRGKRGPRPVLFFDWGCHGEAHRKALNSRHLETWLEFCCDHLAPACRGRSRVLAYVALAVDEDKHPTLRQVIEDLREEPAFRQPHFEIVPLPAMGKLTANDLARLLEDENNTSCPTEYLHDLPDRIIEETGGDFETTVKLLEDAEREMRWPELYRNLREPRKRGSREEVIEF